MSRLLSVLFLLSPVTGWAQEDPLTPEQREIIDRAIQTASARNRAEVAQRYLDRLAAPHDESDYYTQVSALRDLGLPASEGVPIFGRLLRHESDVVKQGALQALAGYGPEAGPFRLDAVALLADERRAWFVTAAAAETLAAIDPSVQTAQLIAERLQRSPTADVQRRLLASLGSLGEFAAASRPLIQSFLEHPRPEVQLAGFDALGRISHAVEPMAFDPRVMPAFPQASAQTQASMLATLEQTNQVDEATIQHLANLARTDQRTFFRAAVLRTLGKVGPSNRDAVQALLQAAGDDSRLIAEMAAKALREAPWQDERLLAVLTPALRSERNAVRFEVAKALRFYGERAVVAAADLGRAIAQADERTPMEQLGSYLELLRAIGPAAANAASPALSWLPQNARIHVNRDQFDSHYLRAFTVVALADIGLADRAMAVIIEMLATSDATTVHEFVAAAYAVKKVGPAAAEAAPHLQRAFREDFRDHFVSFERFRQLANFDGDFTNGRIEAMRALAAIGREASDAIPVLERFAQRVPQFAAQAAQTIQAIRGNQP